MGASDTPHGRMLRHINNHDAANGFAQRAMQFTRSDIHKILENEHHLAQQNFAWLENAVYMLYGQKTEDERKFELGRFFGLWKRAVKNQVLVASRDIAAAISERSGPFPHTPKVQFVIIGAGEVKLRTCPLSLCLAEMVGYFPIAPETFSTTLVQRVRRLPPFNQCDHHIPAPKHAQMIIANSLEIYKMQA